MQLFDTPNEKLPVVEYDKRLVNEDGSADVLVDGKVIAENVPLSEISDLESARQRQRFGRDPNEGDAELLKKYGLTKK